MKINRTLLLKQSTLLTTMCSELMSGRVVEITPDDTTTFNLLNGLALLCNSILDGEFQSEGYDGWGYDEDYDDPYDDYDDDFDPNLNEDTMDEFTQAYIDAALWSTNDDSGIPLDDNYGVEDIDPATLLDMIGDCRRFQKENADDIDTYDDFRSVAEKMAGHNFWLSRNGHGAGFFDDNYCFDAGKRLQMACKAYGEVNLYIKSDRIYGD